MTDDNAKEAAEEEFMERYDQYSAAQGSVIDLLEPTTESNSTSIQAGDDPTNTPD